ncbi:MAG TPA: glycosyltransferase family 1 protein [Rhodospirillales bacterium]|nr:glycosyltransferase family 1 protein [Rhodospirillales bacterium]
MMIFISSALPCPQFHDGATLRVYSLLKEFSKRGEVCFVFTGFGEPEHLYESEAFLNFLGINYWFNDESESFLSVFYKLGCNDLYLSSKVKQAVKDISDKNPDSVIFIEGLYAAPLVDQITTSNNIIMSAVDSLSLASQRQFLIKGNGILTRFRHGVLFLQRYLFEKKYYSKFKRVLFVSKDDASYMQKSITSKCEVVPNGVDISFFSSEREARYTFNERKFLFTGVLSSSMNEEAALYTIELLKDKNMQLVIAGRNPSDKLISRSISGNVKLMQNLPDIRVAFGEWCYFICPIEYGTGIKNNVLQALSLGFPCIVSSLIAQPIGLTHGVNALIYDSRDQLSELIDNLGQFNISVISQNGIKHINEFFSWSSVADSYLSFKCD